MRYVNLSKSSIPNQARPIEKPKKKSGKVVILLLVLGVLALLGFVFSDQVKALFDPVTIVSNIANADLKETDGRTNILILGSDERTEGNVSSVLTDTILFASIGRVEKNVVLISLPRDLWVSTPSGYKAKINAVYSYGGAEELSEVVSDVVGVPVHYYAVVDFRLFEEAIDILGGVEVTVENTFDDFYYPVEGKENAPLSERYETVHFEAGPQVMNGETALKYVRSRKGNNNEGTDFARSKRQQNVIMAIKDKLVSFETLMNPEKIKELYDLYSERVDTNISFTDLQGFYILYEKIGFDSFRSYVLDDRSGANAGGLLYSPEDNKLYGGAYVLIPRAGVGDYNQIHAYIQRYIFGDQ